MTVAIELSKELFKANLRTVFHFSLGEAGKRDLELMEVTLGKTDPRYETFSLMFRGAREEHLEQRTYDVNHDAIGEFPLFITAVERNDAGTFYEAVFNRLLRAEG
ncbi:DUF6916 family protein [Candidatus Korobacter versatilis]|uniref:DUF6916 family protein n=1 Tax=Candidatus Korobacter versatilis TaxID=658062 RepID=UPI00030A7F2A|nr:hypothetical protein [Candidatus Koribacter versatilis]